MEKPEELPGIVELPKREGRVATSVQDGLSMDLMVS